MKIIDFITYVLKCNIFRCLASHEASGSKLHRSYLLYHRQNVWPLTRLVDLNENEHTKLPKGSGMASHEASGSKGFWVEDSHFILSVWPLTRLVDLNLFINASLFAALNVWPLTRLVDLNPHFHIRYTSFFVWPLRDVKRGCNALV